MHLTIITTGTLEHPRYHIINEHLEYWNGDGFGPQQNALLFHHPNHACTVADKLMASCHKGKVLTQYIAPLYVDLRSHQPVPQGLLKEWASKTAVLSIHTPPLEEGPIEGSYTTLYIDWNQLTRVKGR